MAIPPSRGLYALTSLQIGDIQSYVSRLFLLVACDGLKLVFLVDNGPWVVNDRLSRPQELWQLLVHKSRRSPFANRLRDHDDTESDGAFRHGFRQEIEDGWFSLLVALQRSWKDQSQARKRPHGLYGCVAFEVAWSDVRGINYSNELQTDTCVSLELKVVKKREFRSLEQARACYDTILSGPWDTGSSLKMSEVASNRATDTFVRCDAPKNNSQSMAHEHPSASLVCLDGTHGPSRRVKRNQIKTPQATEADPTILAELSRAYISSLNPSLGISVGTANGGCLPEYFTPPSSPYGGQAIHNFLRNYPCHVRETKKFRIVPVDDVSKQNPVCTLDMMKSGHTGSSVSASNVGNTTVCGECTCTSEVAATLDCSKCAPTERVWLSAKCTDDCGTCSTSTEALLDPVYVNPDRLIAPAEVYRDILVLFRFSEPLLPVELRKIIMTDRRLLKMLESGLPAWVIFLQSYPILCHVYRPWMRPLCGTVYYLITIITVLIGFYDLYKNVPVLKATAAHICGPLFEWIEEWEMISRLKYLGTMLFLQNYEKAFEWAFAVTRASRQISVLLMRPVLTPLLTFGEILLPLWIAASNGAEMLGDLIGSTFYSVFLVVTNVISFLIWPFIILLSALFNLGWALLYPIISTTSKLLILPIQLLKVFASLLGGLSSDALDTLQNICNGLYDTTQQALAFGSPAIQSLKIAKSSTPSPSMWRTLWNDILSKVFHAVNGIVKGLAAFITACNRHRLSIYNQAIELSFRASSMLRSAQGFLRPRPAAVISSFAEVEMEHDAKREVPAHYSSDLVSSLSYHTDEDISRELQYFSAASYLRHRSGSRMTDEVTIQ